LQRAPRAPLARGARENFSDLFFRKDEKSGTLPSESTFFRKSHLKQVAFSRSGLFSQIRGQFSKKNQEKISIWVPPLPPPLRQPPVVVRMSFTNRKIWKNAKKNGDND
jgi:hypothetical protein